MKILLFTLFLLVQLYCSGQEGYPVPPATDTRLFYIQHSNNHNTYVYDANVKDGVIPADNPVDIYRIVYTEGGVKKPLTSIQRRMAYGMDVRPLEKNAFEMNLSASKKLHFYLVMNGHAKPVVYITVNNRKMYLDKMYVRIKEGGIGLGVKAEYVLFTGKDFSTGQEVTEKVTPKS